MKEEMKAHIEKMDAFSKKLMCCAEENENKWDPETMGEVIDMVKDLAEARKSCFEGCYYESVVTAMEEAKRLPEMYERMGYNPNRSANGQYSSSGGDMTRMGYTPYSMPETQIRHMTSAAPGARQMTSYAGDAEMSRRYYTNDKEEMKHHTDELITSIRDIWQDADPELKKKMKEDFTKLAKDMGI